MATKEELLEKMQQSAAAAKPQTSQARTPAEESTLWTQRWRDAAEQLATRPGFAYNPNNDPMYQNYREQYTRNGRLAMEDTIGTAAANNGGYGTSYGQMAGQQAYSGYMQGLNDKYPELYQAALSRYQQAGEQLQTRMNLAGQMRTAAPQAAAAMQVGWGSNGGSGGGAGWSSTGGKTSGVDSSATLLALKGLNAGGYTSGEILQALQDYGYSAAQAETALRNATSMKNVGSAVGSAVSGVAGGVGSALGKLFSPITNAYNKTTGAKKK